MVPSIASNNGEADRNWRPWRRKGQTGASVVRALHLRRASRNALDRGQRLFWRRRMVAEVQPGNLPGRAILMAEAPVAAGNPTAAFLEQARHTKRQGEFHANEQPPSSHQARFPDRRRSGLDRGHMTLSGDMPAEPALQQRISPAGSEPRGPRALAAGPGFSSCRRRLTPPVSMLGSRPL